MPIIGPVSGKTVCYFLDHLELWTISVIISVMIYGGLLSLTLAYIPLLLKTSHNVSRRVRNFLLVYVAIMITISTIYIITTIVALMNSIFSRFSYGCGAYVYPVAPKILIWFQSGFAGTLCTALASWGADWFMLWRCAMLYQGIPRPRRIALIALLTSMALLSLGFYLTFLTIYFQQFLLFLLITSISVLLNLVTATLITLRILYFARRARKTVGLERNNPYMAVIAICIESSALIVVFSLIYVILYATGDNESALPMQALVHVYVISPLLIIYRVAQGRAATIRQIPSESGPAISVMYFAPDPPLSSSSNTVSDLE